MRHYLSWCRKRRGDHRDHQLESVAVRRMGIKIHGQWNYKYCVSVISNTQYTRHSPSELLEVFLSSKLKLTQETVECSVTNSWPWISPHLRWSLTMMMCLMTNDSLPHGAGSDTPHPAPHTGRLQSRQWGAAPALMWHWPLMTHTCANHWPATSIITQPECQQNV